MTTDFSASTGEPPLRADARRNRDQIIGAAKSLFTSAGPEVPMEEIARGAGVGVGTLYRRFPDRESLIRAVARDNFANTLAEAEAAAVEEATGWDSLVRLLKSSDELQLSVHLGMSSPRAWDIVKGDEVTQRLRDSLLATLDSVVATAQAEGSLRADVGAGDIAAIFAMLLRRPAPDDLDSHRLAERALLVMLDGLRAPGRPSAGLPGEPIPVSEIPLLKRDKRAARDG
ncbi:TetR/AcrR family transcriptional regulator [Saccharopolyspora sp. NPDC047091]|uniref:TetR/AcrR family transcriptional regulator n=1 Tax=Saccharopolyspora sp. NPDC047091 TaxID=3155924 RepID=UPI0033FC753D